MPVIPFAPITQDKPINIDPVYLAMAAATIREESDTAPTEITDAESGSETT